jgi:hypothetical protein
LVSGDIVGMSRSNAHAIDSKFETTKRGRRGGQSRKSQPTTRAASDPLGCDVHLNTDFL